MPGVYLSEKQIDITPKIQKNTPAVIPPPPTPPPAPPPFDGNNGNWSGWGRQLSSFTTIKTVTITE